MNEYIIGIDLSKRWYKNGHLHRKDGPAVITYEGIERWFFKGFLHREGGPAVIYPDGTKQWWNKGLLHRLDGPAIILPNGKKDWYIRGEYFSKEEWWNLISDEWKVKSLFNVDWL